MKPLIGITVSLDPGERLREGVDYLYVKRAYGRAVAAAGGLPVLVGADAPAVEVAARCAGLVVSGGDDLPRELTGDPCAADDAMPENEERIAWETELLAAARALRKPVLGVCHGMQLMNLALGGTLHERFDSELDHGGAGRFSEHGLRLRADHPALIGLPPDVVVASSHRQCLDRVAEGVDVLAEAPDGLVEAIAIGAWLGVEWHPEQDDTGAALYGWLVDRARG